MQKKFSLATNLLQNNATSQW